MTMRWILAFALMVVPAAACAQDAPPLKTGKDRLSYALGMDIGNQFKSRSVDVDPGIFAKGLEDALSGAKTVMTPDEVKTVISELQKTMAARLAADAKATADKNRTEGETFLAANKAKEGVVTLPSGLQYKVITMGTGRKPTLSDTVTCHYRGTLVDGKPFDSSKPGEPSVFPVGQVIRGWTEVLQLMPVGSKWQVFLPPALGYGERGSGPDIGPNSVLIFEIELVGITPAIK